MMRSSQQTVDGRGTRRSTRAVTVLALALMVFAAGLRTFHAHPFPTQERDGASLVAGSKAHTRGCGVCVAGTTHLVFVDPRTPELTPPDERGAALAPFVPLLAAGRPDAGRPIRAPPAV
jgi:hypothetical protein